MKLGKIGNFNWTKDNFEENIDKTCTLRFNIQPPQLDEPETISVFEPTEFHDNSQPKIPTPWVLFALRTNFSKIFRNFFEIFSEFFVIFFD